MGYLSFILLTLIIGLASSGLVNSRIRKYSHVPNSKGITGAQAATEMLAYHGVSGVRVVAGRKGQDHFDPRTNTISLSPSAYASTSVTALATACHEAGHACQYAQGYKPMKVRGAMVPGVQLCSNAWIFVLMIGIFLNLAGLVTLAVILYAAVVLFELVTLPVEFNASNRALAYMGTKQLTVSDQQGSKKVLSACALTYVAAALTSILQLLWILGMSDRD